MNFSNSYGPRQFLEKFISLLILNALVCRPLPVYGTGFNIRDWLYFGEHCTTVQCVLKSCRADFVTSSVILTDESGGYERSLHHP